MVTQQKEKIAVKKKPMGEKSKYGFTGADLRPSFDEHIFYLVVNAKRQMAVCTRELEKVAPSDSFRVQSRM